MSDAPMFRQIAGTVKLYLISKCLGRVYLAFTYHAFLFNTHAMFMCVTIHLLSPTRETRAIVCERLTSSVYVCKSRVVFSLIRSGNFRPLYLDYEIFLRHRGTRRRINTSEYNKGGWAFMSETFHISKRSMAISGVSILWRDGYVYRRQCKLKFSAIACNYCFAKVSVFPGRYPFKALCSLGSRTSTFLFFFFFFFRCLRGTRLV